MKISRRQLKRVILETLDINEEKYNDPSRSTGLFGGDIGPIKVSLPSSSKAQMEKALDYISNTSSELGRIVGLQNLSAFNYYDYDDKDLLRIGGLDPYPKGRGRIQGKFPDDMSLSAAKAIVNQANKAAGYSSTGYGFSNRKKTSIDHDGRLEVFETSKGDLLLAYGVLRAVDDFEEHMTGNEEDIRRGAGSKVKVNPDYYQHERHKRPKLSPSLMDRLLDDPHYNEFGPSRSDLDMANDYLDDE